MKKKYILWTLILLLLAPLLYLGGVILLASGNDFEPPAETYPPLQGKAAQERIETDTLRLLNWNIGYCGLGKESDFFFDGGKRVRMPRPVVEKNLRGVLETLSASAADFILLQEVDSASRRSYRIDQLSAIADALSPYAYAFGKNYDVRFVPKPYFNPYGRVVSGIASFSRYQPADLSCRYFGSKFDWLTQLFMLDRCMLAMRYPLQNGRSLYVVNIHNSAYDSSGALRSLELGKLNTFLSAVYARGDYAVAGGDWNQFPPAYQGVMGFVPPDLSPEQMLPESYPETGWQWAFDPSTPSNRALAAPFDPTGTFRSVLDFYLVSPNIEVLSVKTLDLGFEWSDHQPVEIQLRLKGLSDAAGGTAP